MKNRILISVLSFFMAILLAAFSPLQILAENTQPEYEYISEVKIGVGKTAEEAAASLKGYTILQKDGRNADLNEDAGGGIGSKGDRVVYLGYKTTTDRKDAVTDLAVMNMKGGYSVKDYEVLMEQQMTQQIIPFVDGFLAAIEEYRENYNSEYPENKARAKYVHDALNKLTDDDCGGAGLGDLLLNETKYEMGDAAYEALSESEKQKHADILTIIAQANGKATLIMENLLVRGADTSDDTWIDRFVNTTYEDLLGLYPDLLPSDAAGELAKEFDDDAQKILAMWNELKEVLENNEDTAAALEELKAKDLSEQGRIVENYDLKKADEKASEAYAEATAEIETVANTATALYSDIAVKEYLAGVEYGDGTLADFFLTDYETVAGNITILYPLIASLSAGQRAGLEFTTLSELVMLSVSQEEGYKDAKTDGLSPASIYENVDRDIYKKGGVALTSEALRAHSAEEVAAQDGMLSTLTYVMYGLTAASVIAFCASGIIKHSFSTAISATLADCTRQATAMNEYITKAQQSVKNCNAILKELEDVPEVGEFVSDNITKVTMEKEKALMKIEWTSGRLKNLKAPVKRLQERSALCSKLMIGFGVAMVVLSGISLYLTYRDLVNYYNVEYTPIPRYMVDEKDITAFNAKGEKIVVKNQAAYYKVVETNRAESDEWFEILGTSADLNGTVGRQWLALYAEKNENGNPIIASSLKVVAGSYEVPVNYNTGIHMFGSDAAYNLNSTQLVWNNDAKSVYVYYNVDVSSAKDAKDDPQNRTEYISEVKIGVGKTGEEAAASLAGYTILRDGGKYLDLNQGAGGGIGSKGERVVYLGYKTTTNRKEAITDLAVMNMKGGYSVKDYELLMEQYMTEQIIPFVDRFLAVIEEYRENYRSDLAENKARAKYVHDALNKLTDDDCGGKGLGDLLLNETKYEMGDAAYEALSESEKAKHADILTIISQANGKATLIIESLLVRAADASDDTWIERFVNTTYEDLLGLYPDLLPEDAQQALSAEFDDDAKEILAMWSVFKGQLDCYDASAATLDVIRGEDLSEEQGVIDGFDPEKATEKDAEEYADATATVFVQAEAAANLSADIDVKNYLASVAYKDGTLADFFAQDYKTVADDVTLLYPLVASLSTGQRAGLAFVSLSELVMFSVTDAEGYKNVSFDGLPTSSIYENVDREIYKKGGVALTSEALRAHSAEELTAQDSKLSVLTYVVIGASAASAIAFGATVIAKLYTPGTAPVPPAHMGDVNQLKASFVSVKSSASSVKSITETTATKKITIEGLVENVDGEMTIKKMEFSEIHDSFSSEGTVSEIVPDAVPEPAVVDRVGARSTLCTKLMIGFGVAMVVFSAASLYLTYRDLVNYYNVDYTPIPRYIVDEKDITVFNEKGEKTVIKNQAAYYKAVECNRTEGDVWYDTLGTFADLNGTVGRQWLALYTAKNENEYPIVASSLKAVVGSEDVPADYTTGIHMFGSDAAYNLNNTQLVWNNDAKSVFVYFTVDESPDPTTSGSSFTAGIIIVVCVLSLTVCAAAVFGVTMIVKKKKRAAE